MMKRPSTRRPSRDLVGPPRLTLPIFPLWPIRAGKCSCGPDCESRPGKHPAALWRGPITGRTFDSIEDYLEEHPTIQGVGARMGDGILCLDFDPKAGGFRTKRRLEREHGPLPDTAVARTGVHGGRRGEHRYYLYDPEIWVTSHPLTEVLGDGYPGCDVKADGGYAVLPPSPHLSGVRYEWRAPLTELADAPDWFIELLGQEGPLPKPSKRADGLRPRRGGRPAREVQEWVYGPQGIPHPQWNKIARITASLWNDNEAALSPEQIADLIRSPDYDPDRPWSPNERVKDVYRLLSKGLP